MTYLTTSDYTIRLTAIDETPASDVSKAFGGVWYYSASLERAFIPRFLIAEGFDQKNLYAFNFIRIGEDRYLSCPPLMLQSSKDAKRVQWSIETREICAPSLQAKDELAFECVQRPSRVYVVGVITK